VDATDGTVSVDLVSAEVTPTVVTDHAWEDASHVLLVTWSGGRWAVVRLAADGTMEYAVPPRPGSDAEPPFLLTS
jgi:hypothetical protein